jgi:hypothetical protein
MAVNSKETRSVWIIPSPKKRTSQLRECISTTVEPTNPVNALQALQGIPLHPAEALTVNELRPRRLETTILASNMIGNTIMIATTGIVERKIAIMPNPMEIVIVRTDTARIGIGTTNAPHQDLPQGKGITTEVILPHQIPGMNHETDTMPSTASVLHPLVHQLNAVGAHAHQIEGGTNDQLNRSVIRRLGPLSYFSHKLALQIITDNIKLARERKYGAFPSTTPKKNGVKYIM